MKPIKLPKKKLKTVHLAVRVEQKTQDRFRKMVKENGVGHGDLLTCMVDYFWEELEDKGDETN